MGKKNRVQEWYPPIDQTDYLSQQHLQRYQFAAQKVYPKAHILDIACGCGYGSDLLAQCGGIVTGVDYDKNAIQTAKFDYPNRNFLIGNALNLPFADSSFDLIVSFETIEHIKNGTAFLQEMKRVLVPGGILIISTPNIRYTSHPEYHVKEYNIREFYTLLQDHFQSIEKYSQFFLMKDYIVDILRHALPRPAVKLAETVGVKDRFKSLLMKKKVTQPDNKNNPSPYAVISADSVNDHLLRIMICVAQT